MKKNLKHSKVNSKIDRVIYAKSPTGEKITANNIRELCDNIVKVDKLNLDTKTKRDNFVYCIRQLLGPTRNHVKGWTASYYEDELGD